MLGIGLMLFCLRGLYARDLHLDRLLKPAFWSLNIGLAMMVFMSLLPAGVYQAWASITQGLWFARSPEFVHSSLMEAFVWLRVPGDIVFAARSARFILSFVKLGAVLDGGTSQFLQRSIGAARARVLALTVSFGGAPVATRKLAAAPGAEEVISYGQPTFKLHGHLVAFDSSLNFKIRSAGGGLMGLVASGEGLVCEFTGQGRIYIQSRNLGSLAGWLTGLLPG